MELIEAVRGEVAAVEQRLGVLREVERLLSGLDGVEPVAVPGPAEAPAAPVRPAAAPAKAKAPAKPRTAAAVASGGGGPKAEAVLRVLRQRGGWVKGTEIELHGMTVAARRAHLKKLVVAGKVEARGVTSLREYRAVASPSFDVARAVAAPAPADGKPQQSSVSGRVLEAVGWDPNTAAGVATRLRLSEELVQAALDGLVRDGEVERMDSGRYRAVAA